ncbi:MAG TPA: phosphoribosylanthranilate isomerase [Candidatus Sulfotelmatobacter sp.]|nr:phosphoribosylanthranilate isomerase [Candidatus Sulfotelmatobacter sp.]
MRTRIKICGCTSVAEALLAVDAGADAVGVLLAEESPRRVSMHVLHEIAAAIPALTALVAVFVDPPSGLVDEALKVGATPQFHGFESAETCEVFAAGPYLKAYHLRPDRIPSGPEFAAFARPFAHATWLFDTAGADGRSGGTGRVFDWRAARQLAGERRFVVSGGLTPANVGECVRLVRPYAVDVRSGVETDGAKDPDKIRAFVRAVREADLSEKDVMR